MTRTPETIAIDDAQARLIAAGISLAIAVSGIETDDFPVQFSLDAHSKAYTAYLDAIKALADAASIHRTIDVSLAAVRAEQGRNL